MKINTNWLSKLHILLNCSRHFISGNFHNFASKIKYKIKIFTYIDKLINNKQESIDKCAYDSRLPY